MRYKHQLGPDRLRLVRSIDLEYPTIPMQNGQKSRLILESRAYRRPKSRTYNDKLQNTYTCFMLIAGRQSFSSSNIDKHTVPDGYTFG